MSKIFTEKLKIALAQTSPTVGDFEGNFNQIKKAYEMACDQGVRFLMTPEMSLCGYPPQDLLTRKEFYLKSEEYFKKIIALTNGKKTALLVGHIDFNPAPIGRFGHNLVSICEKGKEVFRQAKMLLPTYDVFDEARYFEPAHENLLWTCDGIKIGVAICEDLWSEEPAVLGKKLYSKTPLQFLIKEKPDLVLSLSASPFEWKKQEKREQIHQDIAQKLACPLIYVNQASATDEILFDGASFAVNATGELSGRARHFEEDFNIIEIDKNSFSWRSLLHTEIKSESSGMELLFKALVFGIKEYFRKNGFQKALLGLSGGIDSAVVAVLLKEALGAQNVHAVALPGPYSSSGSLTDAEKLAENLGLLFSIQPIKFFYSVLKREVSQNYGELVNLADENLQSRLRGLVLMTLSNQENALVVTTGNKSEISVGYCTLYGDMVGALAPIGDLYKTQVYAFAEWINQKFSGVIPRESIEKAPSAELRPGQKDQDSLPPYEWMDALFERYLEQEETFLEISAQLNEKEKATFFKVIQLMENSEYKRRQGAPILKVSHKSYGIGRRVPLSRKIDYIFN